MESELFCKEECLYNEVEKYMTYVNKAILEVKNLRYNIEIVRGNTESDTYTSEVQIAVFNQAEFLDIIEFFIIFQGRWNTTIQEAKKYIIENIFEIVSKNTVANDT